MMKDYKLKIVATTDVHAHISLYDYFMESEQQANGFILAGSKIKELQQGAVITLDNGDILQGNLIADYAVSVRPEQHPVIQMMNAIGYDAGTLGNHEFNYGLDYLQQTMKQTDFPIVNCNVKNSDGSYLFQPYTVIERTFEDGAAVKVGVTGVVPEQVMMWDEKWLKDKVIIEDMYQSVKQIVKEMTGKCDIIVCLCHSGFDPTLDKVSGLENQVHMISTVEEIDVMVFGHTHQAFPSEEYADISYVDSSRGTIHHVYAVQPVSFGSHLGVVDLMLQQHNGQWIIADGHSEVIELKGQTEINDELKQLNDDAHQQVLSYIGRPIGDSDQYIESFFSQIAPSAAVELVARSGKEAFKQHYPDAENVISTSAPLKAGRDGAEDYVMIPPGTLSLKDAISIYRFPNKVTALKVTGRILLEWLEWSVSAFNQYDSPLLLKDNQSIAPGFPSYNMDIFYELDYVIDLSVLPRYNHAGIKINDTTRIKEAELDGEALQEDRVYIVLTNDYRANFTPFLQHKDVIPLPLEEVEVRDTVIDYIRKHGIDFTPVIPFSFTEEGTYRIKTSHHAQQVMDRYPVTLLEEQEDGFAVFEINTAELRK